MGSSSIKYKEKLSDNIDLASRYTAKSKLKSKYLPAAIVFSLLIVTVFMLTNTTPPDTAQASVKKVRHEQLEVKSDNDHEKDVSAIEPEISEETCETSESKFGGSASKSCQGENYKKTFECFNDKEIFDKAISEYSLLDETYQSDGIIFREGEIESQYRIMAAFNKSKCIINLTSNIEAKDLLLEIFVSERLMQNEVSS